MSMVRVKSPGFEPVARLTGKYRGLMWRILRRQGFLMPGRRATVTAALEWLAVNPCPRKRK
jgi:hypothetical protein